MDEVTKWCAQLAGALAHIHARSIVHRDVKLSNLMVTPAGDLVLIDFGLAYQARRSTDFRRGGARRRPLVHVSRPFLTRLATSLRLSTASMTRIAPCAWAAPASWRPRRTASSRATPPPMRSPLARRVARLSCTHEAASVRPRRLLAQVLRRLLWRAQPPARSVRTRAYFHGLRWELLPTPSTYEDVHCTVYTNPAWPVTHSRALRACSERRPERRPAMATVASEFDEW